MHPLLSILKTAKNTVNVFIKKSKLRQNLIRKQYLLAEAQPTHIKKYFV